jgi:hypothetical protein
MPNSFLHSYAKIPTAKEIGTSGIARVRAAGGFIISFGCGGGKFSYQKSQNRKILAGRWRSRRKVITNHYNKKKCIVFILGEWFKGRERLTPDECPVVHNKIKLYAWTSII